MNNRLVAHLRDGRLLKGTTENLSAVRDRFRITLSDGKSVEVALSEVKAVFFVRTLQGNRNHHEKRGFDGAHGVGRKVRCEFPDGEVLTGFTPVFDPTRLGFFLTPADPASNNERIFVVISATKGISWVQ